METSLLSSIHKKICVRKTTTIVVLVAFLLLSLFLLLNEHLSEENDEGILTTGIYGTQSDDPMTYNGKEQTGFDPGDWYELSGDISAVEAGEYTVIATLLDPKNTEWPDKTTEPKTIVWSISPKTININMILGIESLIYTGYEVIPDVIIKDNENLLSIDKDYSLSYFNNINVGTGTVIITGIGNYCGTVEKSFSIYYKDIRIPYKSDDLIYSGLEQLYFESSDWYTLIGNKGVDAGEYIATATLTDSNTVWEDSSDEPKTIAWNINPKSITSNMVDAISKQDYSGEDLTPNIFVYDDDLQLIINKDYKVLYFDNINSGKSTVKITGLGNYTGTVEIFFNIINKIILIPVANVGLEYNADEQIGVECGDWYTLTNNIYSDVGNYISVATLNDTVNTRWDDTSTDPKTINWSILPKVLTYNMMEQIPNQEYSGDVKTPTIYVRNNGVLLIENSDYTVSYSNNIDVGISTVKVTGIDKYIGVIEQVFSITEKTIDLPIILKNLMYNGQDIVGVLEGSGYTITGNVGRNADTYTATATLIDPNNTKWADIDDGPKTISWSISKAPFLVTVDNFQIVYGDDIPTYDSRYEGLVSENDTSVTGNIEFQCDYCVLSKIGIYKITASGLESINYEISYVDGIITVNKKVIELPIAITGLIYSGEEQVGIQCGEEYSSSGDRGMDAGEYVAFVMLNSNATTSWDDGTTDEKAVDWYIAPKSLSPEMITPISTQICVGSPVEPVVVNDEMNELTEGADYAVYYENNVSEGIATAVVTGLGNYAGRVQTEFDVLLGYLVEYDLNGLMGIAPKSQAFVSGSVLDLTSTVASMSAGCTFIGWSLSSVGEAITEHVVTDNVTLYALWNNDVPFSANMIIEDGGNESFVIIAMAAIAVIDIFLVYLIFVRRI